MEKCIACGVCAEKCPKKVTNEYDAGLNKRKAAYVQYAQAVPLKYPFGNYARKLCAPRYYLVLYLYQVANPLHGLAHGKSF